MNVCNALALLVFQSNAADFVRRLAVLVRLKSCWTNGHDDVMVVCSASHKDDHEVSLLSETRTLVPCTYDLQRVKDGSSTADDGTVTLTTDVSGQPLDRKSVISKASSPLGSKSGGKRCAICCCVSKHAKNIVVGRQGVLWFVFDGS